MADNDATCDIAIVGGGLAGATMALAVRDLGLRIVVIEAQPLVAATPASYDERALALAYGSRRIFEGLGVWADIQAQCAPIRHIHVSDRGHFGVTHLEARDYDLDALGYVATQRDLGRVVMQRLAACPQIALWCPATVSAVNVDAACARVGLQDGRTLRARLVVAADGGKSPLRAMLGIDATHWQYAQTAIISTVTPQRAHADAAYERFTDEGPLALLPLPQGRMSLVMSVPEQRADEIMALDDAAFAVRLYARFGGRLGYFTRIAPRRAFPLHMIYANAAARARLALIGNAAHTLHPIAGQGFNLGLRDIAALAEVIANAARTRQDIGQRAQLQAYDQWRLYDHRRTIAFTDGLARLFAHDICALNVARNMGLSALQQIPLLKHTLARIGLGMQTPLPRLARGLPV
ncbi:MAG: 2-octaprenyl-6-methoxyphenyl hydroxylase [Pseudomonadota bacterium]